VSDRVSFFEMPKSLKVDSEIVHSRRKADMGRCIAHTEYAWQKLTEGWRECQDPPRFCGVACRLS